MTWYAFRLPPMKEAAAHEMLINRGFVSFFAHEQREVRIRSKVRAEKQIKTIPLLHGYALAAHDGSNDWWHRILALRLIAGVVGVAGRPIAIPQWAIDRLAAQSGSLKALPQPKQVRVGDIARLTEGPFSGHAGRVVACTGNKARVLLGLLGSEREATVEIRSLEAA